MTVATERLSSRARSPDRAPFQPFRAGKTGATADRLVTAPKSLHDQMVGPPVSATMTTPAQCQDRGVGRRVESASGYGSDNPLCLRERHFIDASSRDRSWFRRSTDSARSPAYGVFRTRAGSGASVVTMATKVRGEVKIELGGKAEFITAVRPVVDTGRHDGAKPFCRARTSRRPGDVTSCGGNRVHSDTPPSLPPPGSC